MKSKIFVVLSFLALSITGCDFFIKKDSGETTNNSEIMNVYRAYKNNGGELSYEDWLKSIKGEKGDQGPAGEDGVSVVSITKTSSTGLVDTYTIIYSDYSTSTFTVTNGADGQNGIPGVQGEPGEDGHSPAISISNDGYWVIDGEKTTTSAIGKKGEQGIQGPQGASGVSVVSVEKTSTEGLVDTYTITYSDNSTSTFTITNGADGQSGSQGPQGPAGQNGQNGKSAYELYLQYHPTYQGSEEEWLDDLVNGRLEEDRIHTVTFNTKDGSTVEPQYIYHGEKIAKPENPTKPGNSFINWTYQGEPWSFIGYVVTEDMTLDANWELIDYTVRFVNNDGSLLETIENKHYGDVVEYSGETPVAANQEDHYVYTFNGWDQELVVTGDMTFTATYISEYAPFTAKFLDVNDNVLQETLIKEGEEAVYTGETPTKPNTPDTQYEFIGWDEGEVVGNEILFRPLFTGCTKGLIFEGNSVYQYIGTATEVNIPSYWDGYNITEISDNAFNGCSSVVDVSIPKSITSIGRSAFVGCTSLVSIEIPSNVSEISYHTFAGCSSLASVIIPNSVKSIGQYAFQNCKALRRIVIPCGVEVINSWAFINCSLLESVELPDTLTKIGTESFYNCTCLASIVIPNSVISIEARAFKSCSGLISVVIPSSVQSIGNLAFESHTILCKSEYKKKDWDLYWCSNASTIIWGYNEMYEENGFDYVLQSINGEKYATLLSADKNSVHVSLPTLVNNEYKLISIAGYAFYNYSELLSIDIPDNITSIGYKAFYNCISLKTIIVPESVVSISQYAFYGCSSLSSVTLLSSLSFLESAVFMNCTSLKTITIPNSVSSIGELAFSGCSSLTSITISENVTSIERRAFYNCPSLISVVVPKSIIAFGSDAFCNINLEIFFLGDEQIWGLISSEIKYKTVFFYSNIEPFEEGNYWHYVDGVPTVW